MAEKARAEVSPVEPIPHVDPLSGPDSAARRLEELRGYEREAERLRALLRRALGLDPGSVLSVEPAEAEPVKRGDR